MKNKNILNFIFGIIFYVICIPFLESFIEIICGLLETIKAKNTIKILKYNNKISDLQADLEPSNGYCVGFEVPNDEYYEEEE